MSTPRFSLLLADANRQVQIADHLLTVTFPMVNDPKLLLSVVEHSRRALEDAADAVVDYHVSRGEYELPEHGKRDAVVAFADLAKIRRPDIDERDEAVRLVHEFRQTLQEHKEAHNAFKREDKLVIATDGFSRIKELSPQELKRSLSVIKRFVHSANQHAR